MQFTGFKDVHGTEIYEGNTGPIRDSWCIPGEVLHCAEIVADSVAMEVFAPRREEYLPASPSE